MYIYNMQIFKKKIAAGIQQITDLYTKLVSAPEKLITCRYVNW